MILLQPAVVPAEISIWLQMYPLLIGAALAVIGGFFGVIIRVRVERKEEINFIKICLIDELGEICSIVASMNDTYSKSPIIYPIDLNKLKENTANFNDHKKRIYLIDTGTLRKGIISFYKELTISIDDSSKAISVNTTTAEYDKILIKMKELSKTAEETNGKLQKYRFKVLWIV